MRSYLPFKRTEVYINKRFDISESYIRLNQYHMQILKNIITIQNQNIRKVNNFSTLNKQYGGYLNKSGVGKFQICKMNKLKSNNGQINYKMDIQGELTTQLCLNDKEQSKITQKELAAKKMFFPTEN